MSIHSSLLVLGLVLTTTSAFGSEYGPRMFTRGTGAPATVRETFTRRIATEAYSLDIANRGVSSAEIWLNGARVATERDFSQNATAIRKLVALRDGQNEIAAKLAGAPGGSLTITIAAVAGPNGGTFSTVSGATFTVPPGALQGEATIELAEVTAADLANTGVVIPDGYTFHGAVSLDLGGEELALEGEVSIPALGAMAGDGLIVARALDMGDATRFVLADTASFEDGRITTNSPPYTGVRTGGTYLAMRLPAGVGILGVDVRAPDGSAVRDAFVGAMLESSSAASSLIDTALRSQASFLGLTDSSGFAALPALIANSTTWVIASARGATALTPRVGAAIVATGGSIAYPPSIAERISAGIYERFVSDPPDEPPPPCDCLQLDARPREIPLGTQVFKPGQSMQLEIFCGSDDVTQSTSPDLQAIVDTFFLGVDVHWTFYKALDPAVATVNAGFVHAVGPGQTNIEVRMWNLSFSAQHGLPFPQLCIASTSIPVRVEKTGACCDPASGCSVTTESECNAAGGTYKGDDTTCSPNPCPFGACCNPVTGCIELPQYLCSVLNGTFHGNGTSCTRVPATAPVTYHLQSGGGTGGASFPIPFTHGTVKTTVTIPGNIINGQCVRDWRVEILVCRYGGGCQGAHIYAGYQFSICHTNPETITFAQLNPGTACSTYVVNALTGGVSQVTVEVIPE